MASSPITWQRPVTPALVATVCLVVLATAACAATTDAGARPASTSTPSTLSMRVDAPIDEPAGAASVSPDEPRTRTRGQARHWARVLDRLDRLRSRAFERLRPSMLRRVYRCGSAVLRHERAVLDDYRDRGVRLLGVRLRLTDVRLLSASASKVTVRVVERLGSTSAVVGPRRVQLPVDAPTSRLLHLVRSAGGWRIAAARRVSG